MGFEANLSDHLAPEQIVLGSKLLIAFKQKKRKAGRQENHCGKNVDSGPAKIK